MNLPVPSRPVRSEPALPVLTGRAASSAAHWYAQATPWYFEGNRVRLLRGGEALFPAMCEAIGRAREEVWLATYIVNDDPSAEAVLQALEAAARRGVQVRMVVDGFGSKSVLDALAPRMRAAGVEMAVYRPMQGWRSWLQPEHMRRLHQKLCAIDGESGFVGGINLIDDWVDQAHGRLDAPRLDFAVQAQGPVVEPIAQTVRAIWHRAVFGREWTEQLALVARSQAPVRQVRRLVGEVRLPPEVGGRPGRVEDPARRPAETADVDEASGLAVEIDAARAAEEGPATVEVDQGAEASAMRAAFVVRDNLRQRRTIERSYIEAIRQARVRIDLVSPYFYPGQAFRRVLRQAAQRGVQVRLLMQGRWDYQVAAMAARAVYGDLQSHGVRIFEYTPAFLHAKVALVDRSWATVGSSNIDPLSLLLNLEANLIVRDAGFVAAMQQELDAAFAAATEVQHAPTGSRWSRLRAQVVAQGARLYMRLAGVRGRY